MHEGTNAAMHRSLELFLASTRNPLNSLKNPDSISEKNVQTSIFSYQAALNAHGGKAILFYERRHRRNNGPPASSSSLKQVQKVKDEEIATSTWSVPCVDPLCQVSAWRQSLSEDGTPETDVLGDRQSCSGCGTDAWESNLSIMTGSDACWCWQLAQSPFHRVLNYPIGFVLAR